MLSQGCNIHLQCHIKITMLSQVSQQNRATNKDNTVLRIIHNTYTHAFKLELHIGFQCYRLKIAAKLLLMSQIINLYQGRRKQIVSGPAK